MGGDVRGAGSVSTFLCFLNVTMAVENGFKFVDANQGRAFGVGLLRRHGSLIMQKGATVAETSPVKAGSHYVDVLHRCVVIRCVFARSTTVTEFDSMLPASVFVRLT